MYCYLKMYLTYFNHIVFLQKHFVLRLKYLPSLMQYIGHRLLQRFLLTSWIQVWVLGRERPQAQGKVAVCTNSGLGKCRIWQGPTGWCVLHDAQWAMCNGGGQGTGRITSWGGRARGSPFGIDIHSHLVTTGVIPPPNPSLSLCNPSLPQRVPHS